MKLYFVIKLICEKSVIVLIGDNELKDGYDVIGLIFLRSENLERDSSQYWWNVQTNFSDTHHVILGASSQNVPFCAVYTGFVRNRSRVWICWEYQDDPIIFPYSIGPFRHSRTVDDQKWAIWAFLHRFGQVHVLAFDIKVIVCDITNVMVFFIVRNKSYAT